RPARRDDEGAGREEVHRRRDEGQARRADQGIQGPVQVIRAAALVVLLCAPSRAAAPAAAAAPRAQALAAGPAGGGMVSLSLVARLSAVKRPEWAGVFSFIAEKDAPFAFSDLLARDAKTLKPYLGKLDDDMKVAGGLTEWDHAVCASLVN